MATLNTPRRYYLQKRRKARALSDATEMVFQAKQDAEPGTPLAATFPHLTQLATAGYTTTEDLDGADEDELVTAGLTRREAQDVVAAL